MRARAGSSPIALSPGIILGVSIGDAPWTPVKPAAKAVEIADMIDDESRPLLSSRLIKFGLELDYKVLTRRPRALKRSIGARSSRLAALSRTISRLDGLESARKRFKKEPCIGTRYNHIC